MPTDTPIASRLARRHLLVSCVMVVIVYNYGVVYWLPNNVCILLTPGVSMRPPPAPLVRRSQAEVYGQLRDLVVTGQIAPGSRLVEAEVASQLRVSRTPAREAMRRLAQEGLAQSVGAGKRTQMAVAPVTRADLADLFLIVGALEGAAGRGAIALSPGERRDLATQLATLNARFTTLARARSRDFPRFFEAHDAFHR